MTISRWILLRMGNVSDKSRGENQNIFYVQQFFFRKSCCLWDHVENCGGAREASGNTMAARCVLDYWGYTRASTRLRPRTPHPHTRAHTYTHTHKYVILLAFHGSSGYVNAFQRFVFCVTSQVLCAVTTWIRTFCHRSHSRVAFMYMCLTVTLLRC
jgi:hypothetical protein